MKWRDLYRLAVSHPDATAALADYADRAGNSQSHAG